MSFSQSPKLLFTHLPLPKLPLIQSTALQTHLVQQYKSPLLLTTTHPSTFTIGRKPAPIEEIKRLEKYAPVVKINRGGGVTFHGEGQLVGYPIVDVRKIEVQDTIVSAKQVLITNAREAYVAVRTSDTGVWIGNSKIAALGVQVSHGIAWHGISLNCDIDLKWYDRFVACGLHGKGVCSLSSVLGAQITVEEVRPLFAAEFGKVFGDIKEDHVGIWKQSVDTFLLDAESIA